MWSPIYFPKTASNNPFYYGTNNPALTVVRQNCFAQPLSPPNFKNNITLPEQQLSGPMPPFFEIIPKESNRQISESCSQTQAELQMLEKKTTSPFRHLKEMKHLKKINQRNGCVQIKVKKNNKEVQTETVIFQDEIEKKENCQPVSKKEKKFRQNLTIDLSRKKQSSKKQLQSKHKDENTQSTQELNQHIRKNQTLSGLSENQNLKNMQSLAKKKKDILQSIQQIELQINQLSKD